MNAEAGNLSGYMPGRPKIWIVVYTGNSGLTHYSYCLARELHENGADVTLITNVNYELDFLDAGVPVIKLFHRSRHYPRDLVRFWRLFLSQRPDIVHYQSFLKFPAIELLMLELQKHKGARLVGTAHDWLPHHRRFYHRSLMSRYYRAFDRVVVHSRQGEQFLSERLGVKPELLVVIPHGDYGFFASEPKLTREQARERLELDRERFWFLFFGRIDPHKGLDLALQAMPLAGAAGLIIAGNPERESIGKYLRLIAELELGERVKLFAGRIPVEQVQLYFRAADAVVLPYRESSTSGIAHGAMGLGFPLVTTDVGGVVGVGDGGVAGLVTATGESQDMRGGRGREGERHPPRLGGGWEAPGGGQ